LAWLFDKFGFWTHCEKKINWKSLEAVLLTEKIKGKREREKKRLWTGCGEKWTRHITSMQ